MAKRDGKEEKASGGEEAGSQHRLFTVRHATGLTTALLWTRLRLLTESIGVDINACSMPLNTNPCYFLVQAKLQRQKFLSLS
jgi:hypothetical protein